VENGTCHLGEDDCSKTGLIVRGWCQKHYQRIRKSGDPQFTKTIKGDDEARFWSKVDRRGDDECWLWTGPPGVGGYGVFHVGEGLKKAHVWAYEHFIGPIPEDKPTLDHRCHSLRSKCELGKSCPHRRCVNFLRFDGDVERMHLEPVTPEENARRAHLHGVSHEDILGFHARWENGEHIAILAAEAGISTRGLHKRFRELDPVSPDTGRRPSRRQHMTTEMVIALHARYLAGEDIRALADEVGCDRTSIYARFKRMQAAGQLPQAG
jgi:hypothetical protein